MSEKEEEKGEWLVTYADMITLLLTFFVLMVAVSGTDVERFKKAISTIQTSLGEDQPQALKATPSQAVSQVMGSRERELIKKVNTVLHQVPSPSLISSQLDAERLLITVKDQALFRPGQAELTTQGRQTLDQVIKIFQLFPEFRIHIKGHTDSTPISSPQFPSNWELAAVRATSVLRYALSQGVPAYRMTATGLADIEPIAPNDTPENRAQNRRVEFVLEKER